MNTLILKGGLIISGVKGDDVGMLKENIITSELFVFLTPLTFGGYSSELKKR